VARSSGDFADDDTILASLAGLREEIAKGYQEAGEMAARASQIPHRTRYLSLFNDLRRRTLDAQREWLDSVEQQLGGG
jgi:hypothetical protein